MELLRIGLQMCTNRFVRDKNIKLRQMPPPVVCRLLAHDFGFQLLLAEFGTPVNESVSAQVTGLEWAYSQLPDIKSSISPRAETDTAGITNSRVAPILVHLLDSNTADETLELYTVEALRVNLTHLSRPALEQVARASLSAGNRLAREVLDIVEAEVVRRWSVLSCEFRHVYRSQTQLK